jgi:hypothetical protein
MPHKPLVSPGVVRINAPQEKPPKPLADRLSEDLGRMVYTREKPEELFLNATALMHSVLDAMGGDLKPPDGKPEGWDTDYLDWVLRSVANRTI